MEVSQYINNDENNDLNTELKNLLHHRQQTSDCTYGALMKETNMELSPQNIRNYASWATETYDCVDKFNNKAIFQY